MYVSSRKEKKFFHNNQCGCVKNIKDGNKVYFQNAKEARDAELQYCNICSPTAKLYRKEREKIKEFARKHNLQIQLYDNAVFVSSSVGNWKIVKSKFRLYLNHENTNLIYRNLPVKNGKIVKEYHLQKARSKTILGYLEYIVSHDAWKNEIYNSYKKLPKKRKKRRRKKSLSKRKSIKRVLNLIEQLTIENPALFAHSRHEPVERGFKSRQT